MNCTPKKRTRCLGFVSVIKLGVDKPITFQFQSEQKKKKKIIKLLGLALHGKSGRSKSGWEMGLRTLHFSPQMEKQLTVLTQNKSRSQQQAKMLELKVYQIHQDQICELPSNATVLASSKNCPIEMFEVDGIVLGMQGHPEFSQEYIKEEIEATRTSEIDQVCQDALKEVSQEKPDPEVFKTFLCNWLK
ncbi:GMP synthase [Reticulomyxa filosa]|uniref:GMP synthase n=1 Tax=Reticulomyxa filosa TaxID=46433 RepID=X6NU05_RETFI|nr:GMP synthase [Reticulomyxa filosa]|eukprot:ETO29471.1 GMP synthase [Reticulomyxa filosa]